jgi:hypothetical protein
LIADVAILLGLVVNAGAVCYWAGIMRGTLRALEQEVARMGSALLALEQRVRSVEQNYS